VTTTDSNLAYLRYLAIRYGLHQSRGAEEQIRERLCQLQIFRKKLTLAHRYTSQDADSTGDKRPLHNGKQALSAIENSQ
jgi:hypothetical protein